MTKERIEEIEIAVTFAPEPDRLGWLARLAELADRLAPVSLAGRPTPPRAASREPQADLSSPQSRPKGVPTIEYPSEGIPNPQSRPKGVQSPESEIPPLLLHLSAVRARQRLNESMGG